jgi:hypothetical protein
MSDVVIKGNASGTGSVTIESPNTNSNFTLTLPTETGTVLTNNGNQAGTFSSLTVNSNNISADNSLGFRNRIINGDMRIDQRNAGAAVTANGAFPVDRWILNNVSAASVSGEQVQDGPAGFVDSLKYTVTTADASLDADDRSGFIQNIEGYTCADFGFGTANAKTVTVSFWVKSSITGSFGGCLQNNGLNRTYVFAYTISSANTWEYKTVTIPGDTSGTWSTDNTRWGRLYFSVGMGSTRSGTAGSWTTNDWQSFTGATSIMSTLNATFYITGVQLEVGSVATPFERVEYAEMLRRCQRYYQGNLISGGVGVSGTPIFRGNNSGATGSFYYWMPFATYMRVAPAMNIGTPTYSNANSAAFFNIQPSGGEAFLNVTSGGGYAFLPWRADAEL